MTSKETVAAVTHASFEERMELRLHASPGEPWADPSFTILRVPHRKRKKNSEFFEPQMISIGPYHRGKKHLQPMEEQKWRYLRHFLSRNQRNAWEVYFKEMKAIEMQVRSRYAERVELDSDEFARMLLLDGCFILEYFIRLNSGNQEDIFCDFRVILRNIVCYDLLLLENQIPLIVLERLYNLARDSHNINISEGSSSESGGQSWEMFVRDIGLPLFYPFKEPAVNIKDEVFDHLLHLWYRYNVWPPPQAVPSKNRCLGIRHLIRRLWPKNPILFLFSYFCSWQRSASESFTMPCATDLQDSGVTFKKKVCDNFLHITFDPEDGVLEIPIVAMFHEGEYALMNFVAFEQSRKMDGRYITSYALFMKWLIHTPKDVAILQQCGIIDNALTNEEQMALFFNDLGDFTVLGPEDDYLRGLLEDVRRYCDSRWHKNRAILMGTYFNNPWAFLSLIAAALLLLLTIAQTFFAAAPYFHPPLPQIF